MTKGTKKTNRRLKKTVRKTLGTLFLISAIVVAAIPTEGLRAADDTATQAAEHTLSDHKATHRPDSGSYTYKVSLAKDSTEKTNLVSPTSSVPTMADLIPEIKVSDNIYTTGTNADGSNYQFAYVLYKNVWSAVILGYNKENNLPNNTLTIPDTVSAYIQPTRNLGTVNGYVAASQTGEPLYYEAFTEHIRQVDDPDKPILDTAGHPTGKFEKKDEVYYTGEMLPCYYTDNTWKEYSLEDFFYYDGTGSYTSTKAEDDSDSSQKKTYTGYHRTGTDTQHQWIKNAEVKYIGNQYLDSKYDEISHTYQWKVKGYITNPAQGIFSEAGNIRTLNIGSSLIGVGNYAFYNCGSLESISFGNGLTVIGNSAFYGCGSLINISVPDASNLGQIGDHAFYKCTKLTDVNIPISVQYIGDYAFAECPFLSNVELCNSDPADGPSASHLTEIGWSVFENCETLSAITFPDNYSETLDISVFKGCKSLRRITVRNRNQSFVEKTDGDVYCFQCFKDMLEGEPVNGTFYFEGRPESSIHDFTKDKCFAFSYIEYDSDQKQYVSQNKYELTVQDPDNPSDNNARSTYVVDSSNTLISSTIGTNVSTLDIPAQIGPYHIYNIGVNVFANKCSLKMITIPATVQSISDGAFKGCHNLEYVVFDSDAVSIGTDAFKTQEFANSATHTCGGDVKNDPTDNSPAVKLKFVGNITSTSTPYLYAMNPNSNYNNGSQAVSYIEYRSGWPTNITVQYNKEKGVSELIDFPAYSELPNYENKTNYPYLTDAQRQAAKDAITNDEQHKPQTEDQQNFINSALNIVIPDGVQAIKDGLYVEKEATDPSKEKTVTINGLDAIEEKDFQGAERLKSISILGNTASIAKEAFKGCTGLEVVNITGNVTSIGDYAFDGCTSLGSTEDSEVVLSGTISSLGRIPFKNCKELQTVTFLGNDYYSCDNSIIYGMSNGAKASIVECLEGRTKNGSGRFVKASETAGVTKLEPEAFRYGDALSEIDLSDTMITEVPEYAFADTPKLRTVKLPATTVKLNNNVFDHSEMERLEAGSALNLIDLSAFANLGTNGNKDHSEVTICAPEGSFLYQYADYNHFAIDTVPQVNYYTVKFRDWNEKLGKNVDVGDPQTVKEGEDAVPPTPAGRTGYTFKGWDPECTEISGDVTCTAVYELIDPDAEKLTVTFVDYEDKVVKTILVEKGGSIADADLPNSNLLSRDGYTFIGWDRTLSNIQESFTTKAVYKAIAEDEIVVRYINSVTKEVFYQTTIKKGSVAPSIQTPTVSGYTFKEWLPDIATAITENTDFYAVYETSSTNGSTSPSPGTSSNPAPGSSASPSPGNNNGTTAKMYTLTVKNGSGSGSYVAGSQPIIVANDPAANQQFSSWSIDPANTKIASKVLSATVITMPEANVTVTANYTAKSGSGNKTNTSTGSGNSTNSNSNRRPSSTTTGTVSGGRTTVVIDKNGLSNTGVVSATVNGSSDNFVIKITESAAASEEVVKALMAEYGSDISAIKYFPMDISLYDSTGNTKITDTTGLSISITLPLPDSLITYAGNNKVAGVVNSKLDKLSPKFSTISGVSCVTFTAEHFSPYVIYVDTNNLTAGTIADSTPKTGDGIHPKWFLSMGLACISVVLFMKKDKKTLRKARA